ncbi:MAG: ABC transporter ATP-binding protein [Candidatus Omnitrophota bacterium]
MDNPVIALNGITKGYKDKQVLNNLSLEIPRGSVFGLLGTNGAGKTTLIKSILGLMKVSSGTISVLGDNPWEFKEETKEKLGYVPQSDRVYPWLTVSQLIDYTASFYKHWNRELVKQLIGEWGIETKDKYGLLSEGQAQKVAIILALGHEPELLVLDEPVASLDPAARRQFLRTILKIVSERECTVFFSTHITSDVERVADRVALLKDGAITFVGELDQLKDEVKRLRIVTQKNLPDQFNVEGFLHCESSTHEAIVSVRGFSEHIKIKLEKDYNARVDVEDLNLEEIFLELNR